MAYCIKCGAHIPDDARFCTSCGAAQDEAYVVKPPVYDAPNSDPPGYDPPAYKDYQPAYTAAQDNVNGDGRSYQTYQTAAPEVESRKRKSGIRQNKNLPAMIVIGVIVVLVILLFVLIAGVARPSGSPSVSGGGIFGSLFSGGLEKDLRTLVQGNIDELYQGRSNRDFMQLTGATKADCEAAYLAGIDQELEIFADYWIVDYMPNDLREELTELYKEIYSHAAYTVGEAVEAGDGSYVVRVDIQPIDIMVRVLYRLDDGAMDWFYNKYASDEVDAMTEREYQDYDREWADGIISLFWEEMADLDYMDVQSVEVRLLQDEDGLWMISDESMGEVDECIIYYP